MTEGAGAAGDPAGRPAAGPALVGLEVSDPPGRWAGLGFAVGEDGSCRVGPVALTLGIAPPGDGIVGWSLAGLNAAGDVDGLVTRAVAAAGPRLVTTMRAMHPNGVIAVDHVVVCTRSLDAFGDVLAARGLGLRRRAEIRGARMGFRRIGETILEVVEPIEGRGAESTAFWGVTFSVASAEALDRLAAGNRFVGPPRPAVQPGRRIATVSAAAGLSTRMAFIDPE